MITPEQIRAQLGRILASTSFDQADRARAFLSFVVTTSVEGRAGEIKESVIAIEALGRTTAFDPKSDPIVRVEAGRLRAVESTLGHTIGRSPHRRHDEGHSHQRKPDVVHPNDLGQNANRTSDVTR